MYNLWLEYCLDGMARSKRSSYTFIVKKLNWLSNAVDFFVAKSLLEKFWRISLYATDFAIAKLYVT